MRRIYLYISYIILKSVYISYLLKKYQSGEHVMKNMFFVIQRICFFNYLILKNNSISSSSEEYGKIVYYMETSDPK